MKNVLFKHKNLIISTFLVYLFICPTPIIETGIMRLVPTMALLLFMILGMMSLSLSNYSRMGILVKCFAVFIVLNALFTESAYGHTYITIIRSTFWVWIYFLSFVLFVRSCPSTNNYDKWTTIVSVVSMMLFYFSHQFRLTEIGEENGDNVIFYCLMLLPWISMMKSIKYKWAIIVLLILCTLLSLKRSSIIILGTSVAVIYFSDFIYRKRIRASNIVIGTMIVVCIIGVLNMASNKTEIVTRRFESIESDGGNGRDAIFEDVVLRYSSGSIEQKILGRGFDGVRRDSSFFIPVSAHNDFLEVLYDFGAIGFVCYLLIHLSLITWTIRLFRRRSPISFPVLVSYVCFIVMSMVSHLILYPTYFGLLVSFWAYAECRDRQISYCINHQV